MWERAAGAILGPVRRSDWPPLVVFAAALVVAAFVAVDAANHEFVLYLAVLVVLAGLVGLVHRRVRLHPLSLWALTLWAVLHLAGGLWRVSDAVGVLYNLWIVPGRLKFDQAVHAYGFGVATWVVWQGLASALAAERGGVERERGGPGCPSAGLVFLAVIGGMGLGALNEVVEFAATLLVPETNVGGYENTGWDLVANLVGSSLAGLAIFWRGRQRPS